MIFCSQEPGTNEEIAILPNELWCDFPMMDKVSVKGDNIKVKCISFDTNQKNGLQDPDVMEFSKVPN
jgi:glutathione peroxidase-family protein